MSITEYANLTRLSNQIHHHLLKYHHHRTNITKFCTAWLEHIIHIYIDKNRLALWHFVFSMANITGKWHTWIIVCKHTKRYLIWLLLHLKNTQVLAKININCIWNQFAIPQSTVKLKINNHVMNLQIVKTLSSLGTWYIQQHTAFNNTEVYMFMSTCWIKNVLF